MNTLSLNDVKELNSNELKNINGGNYWIPVAAYIVALNGAYTAGHNFGTFLYNITS